MRFRVVLPFVLFLTSGVPARAEAPPKAPRASLEKVLAGGKKALIFDRAAGEYELVKVGDSIQGYRVVSIEDDQMVLVSPGAAPERHFVIPLVDRTPAPRAPPAELTMDVLNPYAAASEAPVEADPGVMDPYAPAEIPAVAAPEKSRAAAPAPPAPTTTAPAATAPTIAAPTTTPPAPVAAPPAATDPVPAAAAPTSAPAAPTAAPDKAKPSSRKLSRKELNQALSDFARLSREIKIEVADGGGIRIVELTRGSFVDRIGLEKGDVVRKVAGHRIDTVDDAAGAYAAVMRAKQVDVEGERRGAHLHIRYELTK
jgi:hypothetical protein